VSEEKNSQTNVESPQAEPQRKRKDIYPFAVAVAIVVLLVLVVMGFLSSQKLHKQVVVLERQLETLAESGRKTDSQVQALADQLAVRALQQQRNRMRRAMRALDDLKPALAGSPELAKQLKSLKKGLKQEYKKLGQEIAGGHPAAVFSRPCLSGRPCPPGPCPCPRRTAEKGRPAAPGRLECANGVCRLVPEKAPAGKDYTVSLPGEQPAHPPAAAARPEKAASPPPAAKAKPQTWWTRFINLRIFGGN
jgi:hypothetical protein